MVGEIMREERLLSGVRHVAYDTVGSTNAEALARAAHGETGPLWISAAAQTAGRGRSGRTWTSLSGNLLATFLFAPDCPLGATPPLSLVAGVAAADAIRTIAGNPERDLLLHLKWPNDILLNGAKLGGILAESLTGGDGRLRVVIGFGINIASAPEGGRRMAALADAGIATTAAALLAALDLALARWLATWDGGRGLGAIIEAWTKASVPVGTAISVNAGSGAVLGTFSGLDATGALLVADATGRRQRFTFGDVTLQSEAAHAPSTDERDR